MENITEEVKKIVLNFFDQILDCYDFDLYETLNKENDKVFKLKDLQGGDWSYIEETEFDNLAGVIDSLDSCHEDYIFSSLEEREEASEDILDNDWDLIAKRFLQSNLVADILFSTTPTEYGLYYVEKENNSSNTIPHDKIKDVMKEILDTEDLNKEKESSKEVQEEEEL